MISLVITLLFFTNIALISAQFAFVDAECAGLPITSLRESTNIVDIINAGPSITQQTYTVTNPPTGFSDEIPRFLTSAIHPISTKIFIIFNFDVGPTFLAILNTDTFSLTIVNNANALNIHTFSGMTFDCDGILYAIDYDTTNIYTIDTKTSEIQLFEDGTKKLKCGKSANCRELLAYNFDNNLFYRISSNTQQEYVFYVRNENGIETAYSIFDPDVFCTNDKITAMQYIGGNGYFLISCSGAKEGIYLLSIDNIALPTVIDIAATNVCAGVGIIASDLSGSICIPSICVNSDDDYDVDVSVVVDDNDMDYEGNEVDNGSGIIKNENNNELGDNDNDNDKRIRQSVLFGVNGRDGIKNVDENNNKYLIIVIVSWAFFVVFLIVNITVFCCYYHRRNKQHELQLINELQMNSF